MRIVNLDEFLKLPPETLFHKYTPQCFEGMEIKVGNSGVMDFVIDNLFGAIANTSSDDIYEKLNAACEDSSVSLKMDFEYTGRDGSFDEDQLFAVYEQDDIKALIARLQKCLK